MVAIIKLYCLINTKARGMCAETLNLSLQGRLNMMPSIFCPLNWGKCKRERMELQVRMDYRDVCYITKQWIIYCTLQHFLVCCACVRGRPCSDVMSHITATLRPRSVVGRGS